MMASISGMMTYFFWELSMTVLALSIARLMVTGDKSRGSVAEFFVLAIALKIWISAVIPQTAAFLGGANYEKLLWSGICCGIVGAVLFGYSFSRGHRMLHSDPTKEDSWVEKLIILPALMVMAPVIGYWINPIIEIDSVQHTHWMLGFINGKLSPFEFAYNYVALWESAYLPGFVFGQSARYFAVTSLQAILLFTVVAYAIARIVGLKAIPAALTAILGMMFGHFWGNAPTGMGTLKNDIIAAAGTMLVILATLRISSAKNIGYTTASFLLAGLSFASVKFSGIPISLGIMGVACLIFFRNPGSIDKKSIMLTVLVAGLFLAVCGIYYIRNFIEFGNPLYPFDLSLGSIILPGRINPDGTRILDHLSDPETWRLFLTPYPIKTGLLTSIIVVAQFLGPILLLKNKAIGLERKKTILFLWISAMLMWMLFFQTPWSAGTNEDKFFYLTQHHSWRYVIAPIQLSYLITTVILLSGNIPGKIAGYSILGVEIGARLYCLYAQPGSQFNSILYSPGIYYMIPLGVGIAMTVIIFRIKSYWAVIIFLFGIIGVSPFVFEINKKRIGWQSFAMDDIAAGSAFRTTGSLFLPKEEKRQLSVHIEPNAISSVGNNLKYNYMGRFTPNDLLAKKALGETLPSFISVNTYGGTILKREDLCKLDTRLSSAGYGLVLQKPWSAVFANMSSVNVKKLSTEAELLHKFPIELLQDKNAHRNRNPHYQFAIFKPAGIFRTGPEGLSRILLPDSSSIRLCVRPRQNCLDFKYYDYNFHPVKNKAFEEAFREFRRAIPESIEQKDNFWTVAGPGKFEQFVSTEKGVPVLHITAKEDMPWLTVFVRGDQFEDKNYMLQTSAVSKDAVTLVMEAYNFEKDLLRKYFSHNLNLGDNHVKNGTLSFHFGKDKTKDYVAVTATQIKKGQSYSILSGQIKSTEWPLKYLMGN